MHGTGPACRLIFWLVKKAGNIEPGGVRQLCSVVGIALGRKAWLFAGSDRGGPRAADMYSRIVTAKLNDVDPQACLADVLARINDQPVSCLHEFLPWNWENTRHANHTQR
ncbi:transposase [Komagataeibacter xylinus NBRC 15237]|nr:transposase [Komagataeibacter xylinus NBRC 15237]